MEDAIPVEPFSNILDRIPYFPLRGTPPTIPIRMAIAIRARNVGILFLKIKNANTRKIAMIKIPCNIKNLLFSFVILVIHWLTSVVNIITRLLLNVNSFMNFWQNLKYL